MSGFNGWRLGFVQRFVAKRGGLELLSLDRPNGLVTTAILGRGLALAGPTTDTAEESGVALVDAMQVRLPYEIEWVGPLNNCSAKTRTGHVLSVEKITEHLEGGGQIRSWESKIVGEDGVVKRKVFPDWTPWTVRQLVTEEYIFHVIGWKLPVHVPTNVDGFDKSSKATAWAVCAWFSQRGFDIQEFLIDKNGRYRFRAKHLNGTRFVGPPGYYELPAVLGVMREFIRTDKGDRYRHAPRSARTPLASKPPFKLP